MRVNKSVWQIVALYFGLPFLCMTSVALMAALSKGDLTTTTQAVGMGLLIVVLMGILAWFLSLRDSPQKDDIRIELSQVTSRMFTEEEETRLNIIASQDRMKSRYGKKG